MFVDTQVRPQGEQVDAVAPAKMKLSAAIRIGEKLVPHPGLNAGWCNCALGAATLALTGKVLGNGHPYPLHRPGEFVETWAREFGFNPRTTRTAEEMFNETRDYTRVADWLESQGL
jgi:hypothetical protein